ncbi:FecCD family ABC transporter permease [Chelatococcus asaccharovorans]|uniref:Iron complex transport system permease protein n=1 Tax=Chelatococcus asaccharovorans TaxID=28210 RepID=A0A2V3U3F9_9HYPH|nr:iron ABC transporter permease [Chelatococcus asaccharovorans]PXW57031.1 iron complex transport system permease protein [Chelatococcus asaccharovorans]
MGASPARAATAGVGVTLAAALQRRRRRTAFVFGLLMLIVAATSVLSLGLGAVPIPPGRTLAALWTSVTGLPVDADAARDSLVILNIRLPRTLLGLIVGATLAVSGALMQGLFRNPLADPGLVGVSSGAALAAATVIVLGERLLPYLPFAVLPFAALPIAAFFGGLLFTSVLYGLSSGSGRTSIATLLLAGVALGAMAGAITGLLTFMSNDQQLRDLTFWSLGSLGGATWTKVATILPAFIPMAIALSFLGRSLNALSLGEAEAFHLGLPVERIKRIVIVVVALAVGAAVAAAGVIGFVGIVVPHLLRLAIGANHKVLLPASALLGAALLLGSDILARLIVAPAELPIGILTAAIGAPFFLWLLLARRRMVT